MDNTNNKKNIKFTIDNMQLIKVFSDAQLAILEIYVCHDGNNSNDFPISLEAIKNAEHTLINKFLVADFDGKDFLGHSEKERIIGFFPKENNIRYETLENGKTYLVANAILSKVYASWAYEVFVDGNNHRPVSMEISVLDSEIMEDGLEHIKSFIFNGVTVLGAYVREACKGSNAQIISFTETVIEQSEKLYSEFSKNIKNIENIEYDKKEITNFPSKGENKKISLRNSNYPQFDYNYAKKLKEEYPEIWKKGGNIRGNEAFEYYEKAIKGDESDGVLDWIKEREAWAARHYKDLRIAGVIANVKWLTIVQKGESYMKSLINEEKKKIDKKKNNNTEKMSIETKDVDLKTTLDNEVLTINEESKDINKDYQKIKEKVGEIEKMEENKEFETEVRLEEEEKINEEKEEKKGNIEETKGDIKIEEETKDESKKDKEETKKEEKTEMEEKFEDIKEEFNTDSNVEPLAIVARSEEETEGDKEVIEDAKKKLEEEKMAKENLIKEKEELAKKFEELNVKFNELEKSNNDLLQFKNNILEQQKIAQIEFSLSEVSDIMPKDVIEEWKNKVSEFSDIQTWSNALQANAFKYVKNNNKPVKENHIKIGLPVTNEAKSKESSKDIWASIRNKK